MALHPGAICIYIVRVHSSCGKVIQTCSTSCKLTSAQMEFHLLHICFSLHSGPKPTGPHSILPSIGPKSQTGCGSLKERQQHRNKAMLCLEIMDKYKD